MSQNTRSSEDRFCARADTITQAKTNAAVMAFFTARLPHDPRGLGLRRVAGADEATLRPKRIGEAASGSMGAVWGQTHTFHFSSLPVSASCIRSYSIWVDSTPVTRLETPARLVHMLSSLFFRGTL
jgi:hypothetical protein